MTFQQLLSDFLKPVNTYKNEFWMDQEMEKFVSEFGQWNGSTLYVNPTGSQLCYYKLPTFYDAVTKMFQAQPKGNKYSALTDDGFIEFSHHPIHDFYDVNVGIIKLRDPNNITSFEIFISKLMGNEQIRKISFLNLNVPELSLRTFLQNHTYFERQFIQLNGSFVFYK